MVVAGEVEQAGVKLHGRAAAVEHGAAQVVVDEVAGDAAEGFEGVDVAPQKALEGLVEGEQGGEGARVAEDHDESGDGAGAVSDADLAERAPVDLRGLAGQRDDPTVDGAGGLRPQALDEASDLDDRAGIAALADHLVDARGAQAGVAGQRVADERQIRVESAGPAHPAADTARLVLDRSPDRLTVEAELGRDGPDLPVLAVVQTPDLGALRGRDHRRSSSDGRGVPASRPATGSTARRPRSGWPRAPEPGRDQRRGVWPMAGGRRNPDPSRGGGRGRRAGGRGGRGDLPGSADAEPGRPAPSGAGRAPGTAACSKHGRDHTPRRWQTGDCNVGRSSGGAGRPRRRSARGDLRLDNAFEPWHNSTDRLALSELGAVTRVRWPYRALTPRFSPLPTLPERVAARQLRRLWTPPLLWTQTTAPTGVCKTAQTQFRTATTAIIFFFIKTSTNQATGPVHRHVSRIDQFEVTADTIGALVELSVLVRLLTPSPSLERPHIVDLEGGPDDAARGPTAPAGAPATVDIHSRGTASAEDRHG